MTLEDRLRDRVFMTKVVWLGLIFSMVLMAIGLFIIAKDLFGL